MKEIYRWIYPFRTSEKLMKRITQSFKYNNTISLRKHIESQLDTPSLLRRKPSKKEKALNFLFFCGRKFFMFHFLHFISAVLLHPRRSTGTYNRMLKPLVWHCTFRRRGIEINPYSNIPRNSFNYFMNCRLRVPIFLQSFRIFSYFEHSLEICQHSVSVFITINFL